MGLALRLGLGLSGGVSFSPLSLFAASEPGFWYDPSDISTLFQDAAGTTPVTAAGQSVARINDKSGRGNHATQPTSLSRPTLGRNPSSGTRNLLLRSEEFDNASWVKATATVTANATTSPDGTVDADKVIVNTGVALGTSTAAGIRQSVSKAASAITYTYTAYLKAGEFNSAFLWMSNAGVTASARCTFNLAAGTASATTTTGSFTGASATITAVGNGWYRCTLIATSDTDTTVRCDIWPSDTVATTGNGTSGIFIWGAQLETGSTATAYQNVVSSFDVTEAGKADCWYLGFDGSDDFLVTPTITPGTDKVQVFAGVRKLSDAADGSIIGHGDPSALNNGSCRLDAPGSSTAAKYQFITRGTATSIPFTTSASFNAPVTNVLTGIGDIAADTAILRVNGAQAATSPNDQGTGNYDNYPVYIGRRGGTSLPFNGRIYSLICRFGPNLTAEQIAQTEAWVNSKTGAY